LIQIFKVLHSFQLINFFFNLITNFLNLIRHRSIFERTLFKSSLIQFSHLSILSLFIINSMHISARSDSTLCRTSGSAGKFNRRWSKIIIELPCLCIKYLPRCHISLFFPHSLYPPPQCQNTSLTSALRSLCECHKK
jgi:hypothetical protein